MHIWLDDERPMPECYTHHARTAAEVISLLATGEARSISLDHDLGQGKTGYDVAKWIEEHAYEGSLKELRLAVHTQSVVGRKNICSALQNAKRFWMSRRVN